MPEISLAKKTDQLGVAKVAIFAYNRVTGQAVLQSGIMENTSTAKALWVLGTGPFQNGTIRKGIGFAGEEIPDVINGKPTQPAAQPAGVSVMQAAYWREKKSTEAAKPKEEPKAEVKTDEPAKSAEPPPVIHLESGQPGPILQMDSAKSPSVLKLEPLKPPVP